MGTLSLGRQGNFNFEYSGDIKLLDVYGLSSFKFAQRSIEPIHITVPTVEAIKSFGNNGKRIVQVAASIVLLLTLSLLPSKHKMQQVERSNVNPISILFDSAETEPEAEPKTTEVVEVVKEKVKPFILVGGSFKDLENATTYKNSLLNGGHESEIVVSKNGLYRVVIDSYSNRETAINAMKSYRSEHKGSNVWVSLR